jgi:hypothetical protein
MTAPPSLQGTFSPGKEKGVVEGIVHDSRSNFLVPVPEVRSFGKMNARRETPSRRVSNGNGVPKLSARKSSWLKKRLW